jgi:hypothetical protein
LDSQKLIKAMNKIAEVKMGSFAADQQLVMIFTATFWLEK